ncbi:MAG: YidC/Oxa1 family membrane protein insertase, partial [Treponema sp.]|nr:YidC/Oxa1 family membrane protein insertase [Treponema sp.]
MQNLLEFLYTLIILPLDSVIETLFYFSFDKFSLFDYGGAIVFVSLCVNLATLPVYNMADKLHERLLEKERALSRGAGHIKRTFKGDESFLLLSEYYAQNGYSPFSPLISSLSILIQIPFFIAAYRFLSSCPNLDGEHYLFIHDLARPDGLLGIGNLHLNILPILMTAVNILSGLVYSRKAPLREKIQIYALALLFLILLYNSPSGLVFYWLLNNLFSLCKNLAQKCLRHPSSVLFILLDLMAVIAFCYTFFIKTALAPSKKLFVYAVCLVIFALPLLVKKIKEFLHKREESFSAMEKAVFRPLFFLSALCLALLVGFALPSSLVASSPEDFSFLGASPNPMPYVASSFVLMAGLFFLWPSLFYLIASPLARTCLSVSFYLASSLAVLNAFVFKSDYGLVSATGVLDSEMGLRGIRPFLLTLPVIALALLFLFFLLLYRYRKASVLSRILTVLCVGLLFFSAANCVTIQRRFSEFAQSKESSSASVPEEGNPLFTLTRKGRNVIVVFLDKAVGAFVPYAMQDFPELVDMFSGFTYYPNTVSFADHTVKGAPALYGGYEYTPENMNRRDGELLKDKHNEALLALPRLFSESGWRVTDLDPQWMNYWSGNLAPFSDYPEIKAMNTLGLMSGRYIREHREDSLGAGADGAEKNVRAGLPRFCLLQILYPPLREVYYHAGNYYHWASGNPGYLEFMESYANLCYLDEFTAFDDGSDSYIVMANESTHDNVFMKSDEKKGLRPVNEMLDPPADRSFSYNWHEDDSCFDLQLYEVNCAALLRLGEWFAFLKENSVWDNSRIIIVSD